MLKTARQAQPRDKLSIAGRRCGAAPRTSAEVAAAKRAARAAGLRRFDRAAAIGSVGAGFRQCLLKQIGNS